MPSAVNDNFSCDEKLGHFISALSLVAITLASCNSIPGVFAPDETAATGVTRQTNETPPESAEGHGNSISGGHY
jgi:hypothetical protein